MRERGDGGRSRFGRKLGRGIWWAEVQDTRSLV
jgi:hypothetical protein